MKKALSYTILSVVVLISLFACTKGKRSGISPGDFAPNFSARDITGKKVSLADFRGKVVLINFWASWCAPCVQEMPSLERLYERLQSRGLVVLAIGVDDEEKNLRAFVEEYDLTFPVLLDLQGKIKHTYRVSGVPESLVVDRSGKLAMIRDPQDDLPTVRMIGPREWDSPNVVARISHILGNGRQ
ncbi:MAG: TlpA family protein disulfide reductase [Candidatus Dadabacteria bacterium]|nr:MAG: TlpA family protein disulfide reductase [Candidatus Dadabacteria bacterium]